MIIKPQSHLKGVIDTPGDKSISHRSIMFGAIAKGTTVIKNFLQGDDCLSSIRCFKQLGIDIENNQDEVLVHGKGLHGLKQSSQILDVGNSGTTIRLMSGILAGQHFDTHLTGDESIQKRPMKRIISPLAMMGASITSVHNNDCAPLMIKGNALKTINYQSPVASAQVKSAILLAGLYSDGITAVTEPSVSRNHSELMLSAFGANISTCDKTVSISPVDELYAQEITVPGDISSAAYFIAAGLIVENAEITIKNVGINPTRDGMIKVCQAMGANLVIENVHFAGKELIADITVKTSDLKGTTISGDIIPTLIDEIPIISILACFAKGQTIIKDAQELKVKESNRIDTMVNNLKKMGADITSTDDGMIINGGDELHGATIDSYMDHRIAMSFAIAGLRATGETTILNSHCIDISYPTFFKDLERLG